MVSLLRIRVKLIGLPMRGSQVQMGQKDIMGMIYICMNINVKIEKDLET
jgi:hypothetical protein